MSSIFKKLERNNAHTCKTILSRLHFWFVLIPFQFFFPKIQFTKLGVWLNCECGLYASVCGTTDVHAAIVSKPSKVLLLQSSTTFSWWIHTFHFLDVNQEFLRGLNRYSIWQIWSKQKKKNNNLSNVLSLLFKLKGKRMDWKP